MTATIYQGGKRSSAALAVLIGLAFTATGCGDAGDFEYVPVSGVVTFEGEPIADILISSRPLAKREGTGQTGPNSIATTDADGRFELRVARQGLARGAVPGDHEIQFKNRVETDETGRDVVVGIELPKRYKDPLRYTVPAGGNTDLRFDLAGD
ncbi:MAG: hypothetical protein AAF532_11730 [Planctomycetota bacterium]